MLHIVTDDRIVARPDFPHTAIQLIESLHAGVALHLRAHSLPAARIFQLAEMLAAGSTGALLLVNDRVDVAAAAGASGVQLGIRSLSILHAREILGPAARIGYSAHTPEEAVRAEADGANFVLVGTIYRSGSHPESVPGGLDLIQRTAAVCKIPIVAIGGVTARHVAELRTAGADSVAVIRAVWDAADPVQAARELVKLLES